MSVSKVGEKITIGINLDNIRSLKRLLPFAKEAQRQKYSVVFLDIIQNDNLDFLNEIGEVRKITSLERPQQGDIDVLFTQDWCLTPPINSQVVAVPHSHPLIDRQNKKQSAYFAHMEFLAGSNYLLMGSKNILNFQGKDFEKMLNSISEESHLSSNFATIIPAGYAPQDVLLEELNKFSGEPDAIFFAQVDAIHSFEEAKNNKDIIEVLALRFPEKEIIYSPYPSHNQNQDGAILFEEVNSKNVSLNKDYKSSRVFARSLILVTDTSTAANTYSYSTLRPHIQCQFYGLKKAATKTHAGWIVYSIAQLKEALEDLLLNMDSFRASILSARDDLYLNIGYSAKYTIDNIKTISKGKSLPEWLPVKREITSKSKTPNEIDAFKSVINTPTGNQKIFAYTCGVRDFTAINNDSPFHNLKDFMVSRSFLRPNAHNMLCLKIEDRCLKYIDYGKYNTFFADKSKKPFFFCCDEDENINSYDFPEQFIASNFAGYVNTKSNTHKGEITLDSLLSQHKNFSIMIAYNSEKNRFSTVVDLYVAAIKLGYSIEIQKLGPTGFLFVDENIRRTSTWEIKEKMASNNLGKFITWGCSGYYRQLVKQGKMLDMNNCIGFIDNNTEIQGSTFEGLAVYSLEQALQTVKRPYYIALAVSEIFVNEITEQVMTAAEQYNSPNGNHN